MKAKLSTLSTKGVSHNSHLAYTDKNIYEIDFLQVGLAKFDYSFTP